jgi:hypothetical protein
MANNLKGLDANQVLRSVYDVTKNTLRVSIVDGSSGGGSFEVVINHTDDSIRLGNGTDFLTSTYIGPKIGLDVNVINAIAPLPTGAATEAKQDVGNASLASIDSKIPTGLTVSATRLVVDGSQVTQPISASSLPLPTGAATEAKQDIGNTSLVSIDSNLIKSDTDNVTIISSVLPTGAATEAKQDTGNLSLTSIDSKLNTLGQKAMAGSVPVTFASDQTPIPIILEDEPIKISGTENGQAGGTEFTFVNNVRQQILSAKDREQTFTWVDFGTKNQRVTQMVYTAPSIGVGAGFTAVKDLSYTLTSGSYRLDDIIWSIV